MADTLVEVEIAGEIRRETERAILFFDGTQEVWIPRSQIVNVDKEPTSQTCTITIPEWMAFEKGLI